MSNYCKNCYELTEKLEAKEQECEELKAEIKHYKQIAQYHGNLSVKYTNKSAKLKQTLTEIKEIAEAESYLSPQSTRLLVHKILQKISESEVRNDR